MQYVHAEISGHLRIFLLKKYLFYYFMYVGALPACVCLCTTCVPGVLGGQKKTLDPLRLPLWTVVGYHVGDGN